MNTIKPVSMALALLATLSLAPSSQAATITENRAQVGRTSLHYLQAGTPGKDLIVFLHGFPEYSGAWRRYLEVFGDDDFAIAPDLRGYGQSTIYPSAGDYKIDRIVEDIYGLVKALGYQKATFVGHDWGGTVSWFMGIDHPEVATKLVIFNSPHPFTLNRLYTQPDSDQFHMFWHYRAFRANAITAGDLCANHFALLKQFAFAHRSTTPEEVADYVAQWQRPGSVEAQVNYYKALDFQFVPDWLLGWFKHQVQNRFLVKVPVMMLWGEDDIALSTDNLNGMAEWVPDLRIERFADANHWSNHQLFLRAVPLIRSFL